MHVDDDTVTTVRGHARAAWLLFARERNLHAIVTGWKTRTAADGSPQISAQVTGPGAAHALRLFTTSYHIVLGDPGDQRQAADFTVAGRTACVWRKSGVWVELWHSDDSQPPVVTARPAIAPTVQVRRGLGDRLPYFRTRRKETKPA